MLGATLPTPPYAIYQARWHLSATIVTVTFAAYPAAVLVTLLLAGQSSDRAGRRPVLAAAALSQASGSGLGTVVGGVVAGAVFMGSLATVNRLAPPGRGGHVISTYFVAGFAAVIP